MYIFSFQRCLQLLEAMIYSRQELISFDDLATSCKHDLVNCFHRLSLLCGSSETCERDLTQVTQSTLPPNKENTLLLKSCKMKVVKIILILQNLSSHQEILSDLELSRMMSHGGSVISTTA